LETGMIKLDEGWNVVGFHEKPGTDITKKQQTRFANGLMNYRRYLSDEERFVNAHSNGNPFFPTGDGPASGQRPKPFPGAAVTSPSRYPSFLQSVIGNAYRAVPI
jgi:hypothetical protein